MIEHLFDCVNNPNIVYILELLFIELELKCVDDRELKIANLPILIKT